MSKSYRVVFDINGIKLTVKRYADSDEVAIKNAREERKKIADREEPYRVELISVAELS
jgi:hypothetical protein